MFNLKHPHYVSVDSRAQTLSSVCLGDLVEINVSDQVTGGIRLAFDPPFKDIPSIIVSPIIDKTASLSRHATDVLSLPSTVVEHVTPKVRKLGIAWCICAENSNVVSHVIIC